MITFFSLPKPFKDHIGLIQSNAIQSWTKLPGCEVILLGDDAGVAEAARRYGARHIPGVAVNEFGTPLLDSAFSLARQAAKQRLLCFINCDIVLLPDFLIAANAIRHRDFLMIGQRWDLDLTTPINFDHPNWPLDLRAQVAANARLHQPMGSDFFMFPSTSRIGGLPAFAVGRPGWDNWMIFNARNKSLPVIDATSATTVIHQNHGYEHVKAGRGDRWFGVEGDENIRLMGGQDRVFTLLDATHRFHSGRVVPFLQFRYLQRRLDTMPVLFPRLRNFLSFTYKILMRIKTKSRTFIRRVT